MSTPGGAEALKDVGGVLGGGPPETQGAGAPPDIVARSPLQLFSQRLRGDRVALVALAVIVLLVVIAIFAPLIVKLVGAHPPEQQNTAALDQYGSAAAPNFSAHYYMGTDDNGRDIFSRVLYGARISLGVAFITTTASVVIGVVLGMYAGYYRGWLDSALSRVFDVTLAFPVLLLAVGLDAACSFGNGCIGVNYDDAGLVLVAVGLATIGVFSAYLLWQRRREPEPAQLRPADFLWRAAPGALIVLVGLVFLVVLKGPTGALIQPGLTLVIVIIVISNIPYLARIIRGQVLSLREKEFVEAALSLGASDTRILFRHILPNLVAPIIVYATLLVPQNILFEAALSFLGVGIQSTSSWGAMIASAVGTFDTAWWYMAFPGLGLLVTVLAFNLVGDGLQDALKPRGRG